MSLIPSPSKLFPSIGAIGPASIAAAGNLTSGGTWIKVPQNAAKIVFRALTGTLTGGTVTLDIQQATSSGGAGAKALSTAALVVATDGTQAAAEVAVDSFDLANGFVFFQAKASNVGGAGALVAVDISAGPVANSW